MLKNTLSILNENQFNSFGDTLCMYINTDTGIRNIKLCKMNVLQKALAFIALTVSIQNQIKILTKFLMPTHTRFTTNYLDIVG